MKIAFEKNGFKMCATVKSEETSLKLKQMTQKKRAHTLCLAVSLAAGLVAGTALPAFAQIDMTEKPVLVITNDPVTPDVAAVPTAPIYSRPSKAPEISPDQISGAAYFDQMQTPVGRKIDQMRSDLFALQTRLNGVAEAISSADTNNQQAAARYNASVATINTALQSGTTPGNPRLIARLNEAQDALDQISNNITNVNGTSVRVAELASMASFLLEAARSTYALSGAIEEDHVRLAQLEDQINGVLVLIERLQLESSDRLSRTNAFLASERNNLRTLSMGVTTGNMFGQSLRSRGFENAAFTQSPASSMSATPAGFAPMAGRTSSMTSAPSGRTPLAKIRFDRPDVNYKQPVYMAVNEALSRYPGANIELVAVYPQSGNAAQVAIENTRSRRNAEQVMRSLEEMGIPMDKINLSAAQSADARSSEVHVFIR